MHHWQDVWKVYPKHRLQTVAYVLVYSYNMGMKFKRRGNNKSNMALLESQVTNNKRVHKCAWQFLERQ